MSVGIKLQELDIDYTCACTQRHSKSVTGVIVRRSGTLEQLHHASRTEDYGLRPDDNRFRCRNIEANSAHDLAALGRNVGETNAIMHFNAGIPTNLKSERSADCRASAQKIHIHASLFAVAWSFHLIDFAIGLSRPIDVPRCELANSIRAGFAQQSCHRFVAEAAPGLERVVEMNFGAIRLDLT